MGQDDCEGLMEALEFRYLLSVEGLFITKEWDIGIEILTNANG